MERRFIYIDESCSTIRVDPEIAQKGSTSPPKLKKTKKNQKTGNLTKVKLSVNISKLQKKLSDNSQNSKSQKNRNESYQFI